MIETIGDLKKILESFPDDTRITVYETGSVYDKKIQSVYKGNSNYHKKNNINEIIIKI